MGFELFCVDGQTDGIHMTKLIFTLFSCKCALKGKIVPVHASESYREGEQRYAATHS